MTSEPFSSTSDPAAGRVRRASRALLPALLIAPALVVLAPVPAAADFRLCNCSTSRVGIALGYKDGNAWSTEGWWNIGPGTAARRRCAGTQKRATTMSTPSTTTLGRRNGPAKAFLTARARSEFTIRGIED